MGTNYTSLLENEDLIRTTNTVQKAANTYYSQNRKKCNKIIDNARHLASKSAPITEEETDYSNSILRDRRLMRDINEIITCDNDDNWEIQSGGISQDDKPSQLVILLKSKFRLTMSIHGDYPLKPPKCILDNSDSEEKKQSHFDHPCIDENNNVTLFEQTWCSAMTLQDVAHFCSIIVQGADPTRLVQTYVKMSYNQKMKEMLTNGTMKNYLLKYTNPVCKCGAKMNQVLTNECYVNEYSYVICDSCDVICKKEYGVGKDIVYHCPRNKLPNIHPHGYDICFDCVYKNHLRYRQFNALIISPPISTWAKCKDADKLHAMFTKLGYHNIITLKDDKANKDNIKSAIDCLYHTTANSDINTVNVIVYTGHGIHSGNQFYFDVHGGNLSENQIKQWIYRNDKKHHAVIDGYEKCKKALDTDNDRMFSRQNTLILINACHSGGFQSLNPSKYQQNDLGILNQAIDDISKQAGFNLNDLINEVASNKSEDSDEKKTDPSLTKLIDKESLARIEQRLGSILNEVSYNTHSALVIASCQKQETSNYFGDLSPFVEYVLDFFKLCQEKIKTNSDSDPITSYTQFPDIPIKLYQYVSQRGQEPHHETEIVLSEFQQNVTLASQRGSDQFVLCPLY